MLERPPFHPCPRCSRITLGTLSISDMWLTRRCRNCNATFEFELPEVEKAVIYLDQFVISEFLKTEANETLESEPRRKWKEVLDAARQCVLLQQAIFPRSNIHRMESAVARQYAEHRLMHEKLSGNVQFAATNEIEVSQILSFLESYFLGLPPQQITFKIDDILVGDRNVWINDLHIDVEMNEDRFAADLRSNREESHRRMLDLIARWRSEKPKFEEVLEHELSSFGYAKSSSLTRCILSGEMLSTVVQEANDIVRYFTNHGLSEDDALRQLNAFWHWPGTRELPYHQLMANLLAALSRKIVSGQKNISTGMLNDISAIANYAWYVDAMFIDRECAALMAEIRINPMPTARIFSMHSVDSFIAYLNELAAGASPEVRRVAESLYPSLRKTPNV